MDARRLGAAALGLLLIPGCSSQGKPPHVTPTPAARPSASTPAGGIAGILCRTHRVQIQANEQSLTVEEAAGHTAAATALRAQIRDGLTAAKAIPGCDVQDLARP
jgi:hypothetical protein